MTEKNNYKVSDIMRLDQLQKEVEAIFEEIEGKYRLSKEEFLILLTLWDQGSMTLKEMDDYVKVKTYKRTRTYNNLVEMKWIVKERPTNDERTVIIHFNEDKEADKQDLINFTCMEIKKRDAHLRTLLNDIVNGCDI
ncbi:MarR family transcriptional regulator [Staphylococcus pseudintermedius]|uniref:transcriptional regulator, SarA/Rot family n=2 Tax=Staphylococcus pseudintermedius TaxID=283734 RepID=UPI000BBCA771|nr:MarR family transcriptional regulator [Staphylococcus pseudintermedius]EGQ1658447.1 MarR family transcriptional regulator [Staphylococcus pseudintermedius]EGQ1671906.1 MarR family transcriptional regulator [Staphylococcus pseudintermedius]EGQ1713174.1 MarR family transcriptional regulator [Staphylococcus pseudintermedius]EGQ2807579.1 MarR family transcriptional regulator [Staphylococcus pseudintermedius]EGQ2859091.1 MarR family transcriptional regulator [Staphylococcus pseudintermedius]